MTKKELERQLEVKRRGLIDMEFEEDDNEDSPDEDKSLDAINKIADSVLALASKPVEIQTVDLAPLVMLIKNLHKTQLEVLVELKRKRKWEFNTTKDKDGRTESITATEL